MGRLVHSRILPTTLLRLSIRGLNDFFDLPNKVCYHIYAQQRRRRSMKNTKLGRLEEVIQIIEDSEEDTIPNLLRKIGINPATGMCGGDWSDTVWENEDVAGWDFRGCDFSRANLSKVRNLDKARFSVETILDDTVLPEGLRVAMLLANPEQGCALIIASVTLTPNPT